MEKVTEIHAYHGWGITGDFWKPLEKLLPEWFHFKKADRGYFGKPYEPEFKAESEIKGLMLHSFGLHLCPPEKLKNADIVIVFTGFKEFHPPADPARSRSQKVIKGMQAAFQDHPEKVLDQFYSNCFGGDSFQNTPDFSAADRDLLSRDLDALNHSSLEINRPTGQQWIIFDAEKDRIVPGERGKELAEQTGTQKYFLIREAHHALPVQKIQECYKILSEELPIFGPQ